MGKLKLLSIVLACYATFMLSACSSSDKYSKDEAAAEPSAENMAMEESGEFYSGGAAMDFAAKQAAPEMENIQSSDDATTPIMDTENQPNLKLIWYANLEMETLNYDELIKGLNQTLAQMNGFVESSSQSGGIDVYGYKNERSTNLTIRIPSAKLDEFLGTVSTLGNVTYQSKRSENITLEYADSEARLETLKIEYDKLLELLEKAENLDSVIALEARLSEVRYQMDGLSSSLRKYDNLVDYSTINLNIYEVEIITEQPNDSIGDRISLGFKNTFVDIKNSAEDILVYTVVKSPFIIALIVVTFVVIKALNKLFKDKSLNVLKPKLKRNEDLTYPKMENSTGSSDQEHADKQDN